jgi:hypothetical protein
VSKFYWHVSSCENTKNTRCPWHVLDGVFSKNFWTQTAKPRSLSLPKKWLVLNKTIEFSLSMLILNMHSFHTWIIMPDRWKCHWWTKAVLSHWCPVMQCCDTFSMIRGIFLLISIVIQCWGWYIILLNMYHSDGYKNNVICHYQYDSIDVSCLISSCQSCRLWQKRQILDSMAFTNVVALFCITLPMRHSIPLGSGVMVSRKNPLHLYNIGQGSTYIV